MIKNLFLLLSLISTSVFATVPPTAQEQAYIHPSLLTNTLSNPSFERGLTGVTADANIVTIDSTDKIDGTYSIIIDTTAAQTVQIGKSSQGRLPYNTKFFGGRNCVASFFYRTPSSLTSTITVSVRKVSDDTVLGDTTTISSVTGSAWQKLALYFACDSSSAPYIQIATSAAETAFQVDQFYLGNVFMQDVSQTVFAGESYFAGTANCSGWTRTSTTVGPVATDADCPGPTIVRSQLGSWQTTDSDLPIQTINNLPAGVYVATFYIRQTMGANNITALAINDGTTTCEPSPGQDITTNFSQVTVSCSFSYTSAGTRAFQLYVGSNASSVTVGNDATTPRVSTRFTLQRYPTGAEASIVQHVGAEAPAIWTGYHEENCGWSTGSTSYADPTGDASCTFTVANNKGFSSVASATSSGNNIPGIVFTPPRPGRYRIRASVIGYNSTSTQFIAIQLTDGTNVLDEAQSRMATTNQTQTMDLEGVVLAASTTPITVKVQMAASANTAAIDGTGTTATQRSVSWEILNLDVGFGNAYTTNALYTGNPGQERIERATFAANNGSTCVVSRSSSSFVTSCTRNGAGQNTIVFNAGVWSATPTCMCTVEHPGTANRCEIDTTTITPSPTTIRIQTTNGATTAADRDFGIICMGTR